MKVLIVDYDDWQEMFIDGVVVAQGDPISVQVVLEKCGIDATTRDATKAEVIEKLGYDPEIGP